MSIIKVYVDKDTGEEIKEEVVQADSPWMRITEAAAYHGVTVWTIHEWVRRGILTKYRIDGLHNVRVKREDVENLFQPVS